MRDAVQTVGNLIDKQGVAFISSVDENGFPNTKAMLPPRKRAALRCSTLPATPPLCGQTNTKATQRLAYIFAINGFLGALCSPG